MEHAMMPYRTLAVKLSLLVCFAILSLQPLPAQQKGDSASGAAWPVVRGNALQTGVAATTLPDKLETVWTFKAKDAFEGAVAIADGVVYAGCYDEHLYAIDLTTGKQKWKYKMGPTKAAPAVHKGTVYIGDEDGTFHAVDVLNGQKRWTFETKGEITATANFFGDDVLIGSYDGVLYCLSRDGKVRWKVRTEGPVNGSPAVVGERTFVAGCDSQLHIIDLMAGKEVGKVDLGGQAAATAAVKGDHLYVGTMANEVQGINWKKADVTWTFKPERRAREFFASAAVTDKLVIVGSRDRKVYALDRDSGKKVWEFETGSRVDPSPIVVGQRVYAASGDGNLYVLDLAKGTKIQQLQLGRSITASPAAAQEHLVIGTTDGVLYCLGKKR